MPLRTACTSLRGTFHTFLCKLRAAADFSFCMLPPPPSWLTATHSLGVNWVNSQCTDKVCSMSESVWWVCYLYSPWMLFVSLKQHQVRHAVQYVPICTFLFSFSISVSLCLESVSVHWRPPTSQPVQSQVTSVCLSWAYHKVCLPTASFNKMIWGSFLSVSLDLASTCTQTQRLRLEEDLHWQQGQAMPRILWKNCSITHSLTPALMADCTG